jgi:hypothetical protein
MTILDGVRADLDRTLGKSTKSIRPSEREDI